MRKVHILLPNLHLLLVLGSRSPKYLGTNLRLYSITYILTLKHSSPQTPDAAADDRSSIGESIGESSKASSRVRKSEAERMEFLQSDPHSGEVEPHRVFCTACKAWVGLNPKRRYVMALWITHRKQCGKKYTHYEKYVLFDYLS